MAVCWLLSWVGRPYHYSCISHCTVGVYAFNCRVLNTDNMSIIGVTIDYGPFGFMDRYDPGHICNGSGIFIHGCVNYISLVQVWKKQVALSPSTFVNCFPYVLLYGNT